MTRFNAVFRKLENFSFFFLYEVNKIDLGPKCMHDRINLMFCFKVQFVLFNTKYRYKVYRICAFHFIIFPYYLLVFKI